MENLRRFLAQHKFTQIFALLTASLLMLISLWPDQARGQAGEEDNWIRPGLVESGLLVWPTDCTRAYTAACLPIEVTVNDLPFDWQDDAWDAAETWSEAGSKLEFARSSFVEELRPIMATYPQGGGSVDLGTLGVGEIRIIPSDEAPVIDLGDLAARTLPYANPREPDRLIAALIIIRSPLPEGIDLRTLIAHELGHAAGLPDSVDSSNVMYAPEGDHINFFVGRSRRELGERDLRALFARYGQREAVPFSNILTVQNNSGVDVCGLYVTRSSWPYWGNNLIEEAILEPGDSKELWFTPGPYDARAVACDGAILREEFLIDLSRSTTWPISAVEGPSQNGFVVQNDSGAPICELYVSPSSSPSWGAERLRGTRIEPGKSYGFGVDPGRYDARAVACDSTKLADAYGLDVGQPYTWVVKRRESGAPPATAEPPTVVVPTSAPPAPTAAPPTSTAEECTPWIIVGPAQGPTPCPQATAPAAPTTPEPATPTARSGWGTVGPGQPPAP